ncbi:MAG: SdrD B-like domain-containing protein, partial [candidate division WOR-3 bacterium]
MPKKVSILILIAILFVSSSLANNIVSTDKKPLDEKFVIHKLNSKTQLPDRLTKLNLNAQLMNESSSNNHHKYIEIKRRIESGLTENYKMMPNKMDVFGELKFSKEKLLNAIENLNGDNGKRFATTFLTCLVDGDYCYIAGESYPNGWVIVLNVADTSNIFRVAQVPTQIFWIPSLAKSGNRLYVVGASHRCGKLKVIDVSNPSSPTIIGSMDVPDTTLFDIEVQGDYAIIGDRRGVRIVNIANPNNLQTVGYVASLPWCFQLTVAGNFAYAISDCYKFAIIDITNPNTPNLRGSLEIECFDVRVRDNRAYIACENGLGIIDVSNPDVPKLLYSNFETRWLSCVTDGNYTYATGVMDDGETFHGIVTIFDVADINNIKEVAQVGLGPLERENYGPSIFKSDNYIYVAGNVYETDNSKLWIIDVTNPILPEIKSEMTFADMTVRDIFVQNNFAYIAHFEPGGLRIVDVSIPENPITRSVLEIENCYSVFVLGSYAYVIEGFQNLVAVDVSNPDQPIRMGDIELDLPRDICVRSNYAYVCGDNTLFVVDVSDPNNLQLISDEVEASGHTIEFSGNYAYIAGDGLYIVDVTNLANPFIASSFADCYSYEIDAISVQGNFVYNTYQDELRVIDCSDFGPPQIGRWGKVGLDPIYVVGDVGYCGADWKGIYPGLFTFDLSTPTNPDTFTYYNVTGERVYDIYVSGDYAYLANGASGLRIINISDPEQPQEVGNYPTPDSAFGVSVIYPYAYVACRDAGLRIINVSGMVPPYEVGAYVCENARKVFTVQTVLNTYAYVVGGFYGFLILDVTMPSNIDSIGSYYGFASDITVRNNLAYVSVTHWEPGLHIVDISTPSIPTRIGYFPLDTKSTSRLYLNNNLIYLTHHYATTIIDVSTPQSPVRIGSINTRSYDVWANNNYAYITGHGLRIFDVYDPTGGIYIAGRYKFEPEEYCAWTLELSGDYAYTAWGGLYIYDVATYPTIPLFLADFSDCDCEEHDGISVQNGLVYNVFERQLNIIDCNDLGNIFICGSYELEGLECSISGIKFNDINGNGQKDAEDYGIPNWTIRLDPGPIFIKTNSLGEYTFTDLPYGTYTVSEETKNYWQQTCPINGTYTVVLDNVVPNVSDSNFGNHASTEIQDLACGIGGGVARPGIYKKYHITYENKGTVTVNNVVVTCTIPTQVMYVNCSSGGIYNGIGYGGTVTWNIGPVIPCAIEWLWVEVYIPTSLGIGAELHSAVNIEPLTGDFNPEDNYDDETEIVVGSYDPNEKSVTPEGLITQTTELEYFVRFQNVGTAPAIDIEITDTLDSDLDP